MWLSMSFQKLLKILRIVIEILDGLSGEINATIYFLRAMLRVIIQLIE
jgi:hypothetical protein